MRFEYDPVSGAGYIGLRAGQYEESIEIAPGCYLDIDEDGTVLGLEFLGRDELLTFMARSVELPERIEDPETFSLKSLA